MEKTALNYWAQFFANEKLTPASIGAESTLVLMKLCAELAKTGSPFDGKGISHASKIAARRLAVNTAMDLGIDLMKMRKPGRHRGSKPAMGRGLLDVWNEEYAKRFGSTVGTPGAFEIKRRKVSGGLANERQKEAVAKKQQAPKNEQEACDRALNMLGD